jgi:hypothetical protein
MPAQANIHCEARVRSMTKRRLSAWWMLASASVTGA